MTGSQVTYGERPRGCALGNAPVRKATADGIWSRHETTQLSHAESGSLLLGWSELASRCHRATSSSSSGIVI